MHLINPSTKYVADLSGGVPWQDFLICNEHFNFSQLVKPFIIHFIVYSFTELPFIASISVAVGLLLFYHWLN